MPELQPDDNPWVIPLHGVQALPVEAPRMPRPRRPATISVEDISHLYPDDGDLPTIEFRPQLLRRAA